jgi:hypothetical protein
MSGNLTNKIRLIVFLIVEAIHYLLNDLQKLLVTMCLIPNFESFHPL